MPLPDDAHWMALALARLALDAGEVPPGAVVGARWRRVGRDRPIGANDPTAQSGR